MSDGWVRGKTQWYIEHEETGAKVCKCMQSGQPRYTGWKPNGERCPTRGNPGDAKADALSDDTEPPQ